VYHQASWIGSVRAGRECGDRLIDSGQRGRGGSGELLAEKGTEAALLHLGEKRTGRAESGLIEKTRGIGRGHLGFSAFAFSFVPGLGGRRARKKGGNDEEEGGDAKRFHENLTNIR